MTEFTRETLLDVHRYLMQDIYPWAGEVRTTEVGAMGMAMCRAQYVEAELDRVMKRIAKMPVSATDKEAAVRTVADHWSELTIVHPFRDGNSRTQRFYFDQMLRAAGWSVDWTRIDASQAHAARYVGAATADPSFLAQVLIPGVFAPDELPADAANSLAATQGNRNNASSAEIFHRIMAFRREHPAQPWDPSIAEEPAR
ncbi:MULTISPECIES: Fic family protein [Corynebacterium]|uniref:Fic/DOC family protein n=1 Tax=Corynebacterium TaxID=1716 RepID=UPI001F441CEE|nr:MULTISPECIES: Fic family protein [Corynebacterium]